MRTFTPMVAGVAGLLLTSVLAARVAQAAPPGPAATSAGVRPGTRGVGPEQLGRAFQRARRSILQVRTSSSASRFDIGTYVGAHGELVYASAAPPPPVVSVSTPGGPAQVADVLAHSASSGLVVARVRDTRIEPLAPSDPPDLALEQWVIAVRLGAQGRPEPFAGVVSSVARPWSRDRGLEVVQVDTPAERGSPILTTDGRLIAFALERGARRTRAVMLSSLLPFLRQAVLGP